MFALSESTVYKRVSPQTRERILLSTTGDSGARIPAAHPRPQKGQFTPSFARTTGKEGLILYKITGLGARKVAKRGYIIRTVRTRTATRGGRSVLATRKRRRRMLWRKRLERASERLRQSDSPRKTACRTATSETSHSLAASRLQLTSLDSLGNDIARENACAKRTVSRAIPSRVFRRIVEPSSLSLSLSRCENGTRRLLLSFRESSSSRACFANFTLRSVNFMLRPVGNHDKANGRR